MKRMALAAALIAAVPFAAQAQTPLQPGGFYIGVEGGGTVSVDVNDVLNIQFAPPSTPM